MPGRTKRPSDENSEIISEFSRALGYSADEKARPYEGRNGFSLSDGSISVLMETKESAKNRNARVYCRITGYGMAHSSVAFGTVSGSEKGLETLVKYGEGIGTKA